MKYTVVHHIWREVYMYNMPRYGDPDGFTALPETLGSTVPQVQSGRLPEPYMPPGPPEAGVSSVRDNRLISDIKEAVIKEVHAYDYYTRLAAMVRDDQDRQTLLRIRHDEMKHYRWFSAILQRLGAEQPEIPTGTAPRNFMEGVRDAIRDELEAAAFYQSIAYRARDRSIEMHFLHAAQDEQRHAAWLQYMLSAPQPVPYS